MTLDELGWNEAWALAFAPYRVKGRVPGRVAIPHRGVCWVYTEAGEIEAATAGRLRRAARGSTAGGAAAGGAAALPAAGDWVAISPATGGGRGRIEAVLPRATVFSRKVPGKADEEQVVAANADAVLVVTAAGYDLNLRRLERYLAVAWASGAQPVVVVTKSDLDPSPEATDATIAEAAVGVPVHRVSGKTGEGLEALRAYLLPGRTAALLGSSGVGKSTLINALLGVSRQEVGAVGESGGGRHTTTQRELILVPAGGLLLDTPGMRELQLWDTGTGVVDTFSDVEELAARCRFANCRHDAEPECAVREASESGVLAAGRLASFRKLAAEQRFRETQLDRGAQAEVKRTNRTVHKALRSHLKKKYGKKS